VGRLRVLGCFVCVLYLGHAVISAEQDSCIKKCVSFPCVYQEASYGQWPGRIILVEAIGAENIARSH
jgi:hypothetical protein